MPSNKDAGKAFEFALISEANRILSPDFSTDIIEDDVYIGARDSFSLYPPVEQVKYIRAANAAIAHIVELEPRLQISTSPIDILQLQLMPDAAGQKGDVRDVLFIRSEQNWQIGISAKNNHKAVKHSRLSRIKNFGEDWLGISCSGIYFEMISPIFERLQQLKNVKELWKNIPNKQADIYVPILNAFKTELLQINQDNQNIPQALIGYLIGSHDFYKVIKKSKRIEVIGFNINGTLNKNVANRSLNQVQRLKLPTEIIRFEYKPNSRTTLLLVCNEGWQVSFRLHSAETLVIPSLKFDTNLIGHPESLYSHHITY